MNNYGAQLNSKLTNNMAKNRYGNNFTIVTILSIIKTYKLTLLM